jgi:hypothetical protein
LGTKRGSIGLLKTHGEKIGEKMDILKCLGIIIVELLTMPQYPNSPVS